MPYGMSMSRFVCIVTVSMLSMCAGSQCVHAIYKPLDDLDDLIAEALKARLSEEQNTAND